MAFQTGAVFSEVTLFPKKRHSFGSTFFVFFPRRRFETQETVPTGIVARPRVSLESVTRPAKKPKRSSQVFSARAFSQPAAGGVEKDRPNLSFASRSVGGLDASARSREAPTGTTGSRRVASSIRARSRERAACRASAGTRRATGPSRHHHRFIGERWMRGNARRAAFRRVSWYRTTTRVGACFAHNTNIDITCAACFREMDTKLKLSRI